MIRELITRFNRSLSERMVSSRRRHKAPMKVWFEPEVNTDQARDEALSACICGEIADISRTGIGFIVPSIRIKEKYLVGQQRNLNIEIELPTGKIFMRAVGCRYEKVGVHLSAERFFVGAQILNLTGVDKENYETFLQNGNRPARGAASMELGN
ncbi:MAG: PilZ domain-containing protein [Chloracidobacterium sp.]|nr:PilZ domain-containing protein [Chloracidobacterium sp.]